MLYICYPLPWTNVTWEGPIQLTKILKSIFHLFLLKGHLFLSIVSTLCSKLFPTLLVGIPDAEGENRIPMPIAIKRLQKRTILNIQICIEWCNVYTCCGLPLADTWVLYTSYKSGMGHQWCKIQMLFTYIKLKKSEIEEWRS